MGSIMRRSKNQLWKLCFVHVLAIASRTLLYGLDPSLDSRCVLPAATPRARSHWIVSRSSRGVCRTCMWMWRRSCRVWRASLRKSLGKTVHRPDYMIYLIDEVHHLLACVRRGCANAHAKAAAQV